MSITFCRELPKIELHAHLNGSLSRETLKKLGCPDDSITEYQKLTQLIDKNDKTLDECFQLFDVAHNATNDQKSVYLATKSVIEDFADDNVIYLELRTTPREGTDMTKEQYIENVVQAVKDNHRDIIVKILLSLNRGHGRKDLEETMDLIIEMKNKYPELIKGVDLSGNPSVGDFPEDLFQKAKDNGLFRTIHCAEIKNDEEVAMILNHRPDRIGHATFLHPNYGGSQANWDLYCKLKIPTECCLTSNVVCGTSKSYENHHVQEWIKSDLPFCLNTDDKGVFDANLSDEFCHICKNFDLSKKDLWDISFKAVDFSFATNEEKNTLKSKLESWKKKTNLI